MFSQNNDPKEFLNNFITFLNENNKSKVSYNCYEELLKKFNNKKDFLVNKKLQIDLSEFIFENKIAGFGEHSIVSEKSINDFLLIEDSIDNLELFWILFGIIVLRDRFSSNRLNDYKKIIFKKNRLSIGLYIRSLLANFMFIESNPSLVFGGTKKLLEKKLLFFWNSYFENIGEEDEIILFRGFILNKGKIIRNPKVKDKQLEGSGICYSVNREVAVSFATTLNPYLDLVTFLSKSLINDEKNLLSFDKKFREKIINNENYKSLFNKLKLEKEKSFADDLLDNKPLVVQDDCRSIVGKYRVKKKDIIIISNNRVNLSGIVLRENQVVCFPEFISLKRYDYVNHKEFLKINSQIKTEEQLFKIFYKKRIKLVKLY